MSNADLPSRLTKHLADSEIELLWWDPTKCELGLRVRKDIGPETGIVRFSAVSHINLPPRLTVEALTCSGSEDLPSDYFEKYRPGDKSLDPDECLFTFHGSWGDAWFVVACSIS